MMFVHLSIPSNDSSGNVCLSATPLLYMDRSTADSFLASKPRIVGEEQNRKRLEMRQKAYYLSKNYGESKRAEYGLVEREDEYPRAVRTVAI